MIQEINCAFEAAVRRHSANWFRVHNRWKPSLNPTAAIAVT
jgi:lauroyl/myristoyl acyltransferase